MIRGYQQASLVFSGIRKLSFYTLQANTTLGGARDERINTVSLDYRKYVLKNFTDQW